MQRIDLQDALKAVGGILIMDGSMATALENLGCDLSDKLQTAKILATHPEKIKQVHLDYLNAGANCGITASYRATIPGLMKAGYSMAEAERIIQQAVQLFMETRQEWLKTNPHAVVPLCLGAGGPYGAYLADGSEYRGHYDVSDET